MNYLSEAHRSEVHRSEAHAAEAHRSAAHGAVPGWSRFLKWPVEPNRHEPLARTPRLYTLVCMLLVVLMFLYIARGIYTYTTKPVIDTDRRWQEVQYLMKGVDPNTLHWRVAGSRSAYRAGTLGDDGPPFFTKYVLPDRDYAIGVYPAYTYVMSVPLMWPQTVAGVRLWFFPTAIISLVAIVWFIHAQYLYTLPGGLSRGLLLLPLATLCASSVMDVIHTGNYSLIVVAALVGMFISMQKRRPVQSGLWLALAMIKPTLAVPFGLVLLVRRRFWPGIVACAAVLSFLAGVAWFLTDTSPLASSLGALEQADQFVDDGGGLSAASAKIDAASVEVNSVLAAIVVCLAGLLALFLTRDRELHLAFAVAAVVGILCAYHRSYDHYVLIFLLLYIGRGILRLKQAGASATAGTCVFFLVVATLVPPTSLIGSHGSNLYREIIWAACLMVSVFLFGKPERR